MKTLLALVAAVLLSLPAAAICPGTYSVVEFSGTVTSATVVNAINAAPAGPVLVRPTTGQSTFTVTGGIAYPRACVTITSALLPNDGINFSFGDNGSEFRNGAAKSFYLAAADDIVLYGNTFDGLSQVNQNFIQDGPAGDGANRLIIENNLFTRYWTPITPQNPDPHSEALYIGGYSDGGLIRGNTFTDNGTTAHIFFTWWGVQPSTAGYPRNYCVVNNVFNARHGAFFDIDWRSEIPASSGNRIAPGQDADSSRAEFNGPCGPTGPTLQVNAAVSPSSGPVPLANADVVLSGTGTATGNVTNARIDCSTSDGASWWLQAGNQATAASCNAAVISGNETSCAIATTSGLGSSFSINFNDQCNFTASSTITVEATRQGITESGTAAFSATAPQVSAISDDFSSGGLANWVQDILPGSWSVVGQELNGIAAGGDGTAFLRYGAATLDSNDQCASFRIDNDSNDAPGVFFRGTSTNPALSTSYHFLVAFDQCTVPGNCPLVWRSYSGGGTNVVEGQITSFSMPSLPYYYGAKIAGTGMSAVMSVYASATALPDDCGSWPAAIGTISKTDTTIITDTGRSVGVRRYKDGGSGTLQMDDVRFTSAGPGVVITSLTPAAPTTSDPLVLAYARNNFTATSCTTSWSGANTGSRADPAPLGSDVLPETPFDVAGATNFQVVCQPGNVTSPVVTRTFTAPTPATMDFTVSPGNISGPSPQTANTSIVITGTATGLALVEQDRDGNGTFGDQYPDIGPSSGTISYDIPDSPAFADTGRYAIRVTRDDVVVTKVFDVVITGVATLHEVLGVRVENGDRCRPARNAITLAESPAVTIVDRSDGACPNPVTVTNAYPSVGAYTAATGSLDATLTTPTATIAANDDTVPFAALGETGFCGSALSEIVSLAIPTPPTCATAANGLYGFVARGFTGDLVANEPTGTGGAEKTYIWRVGDIVLSYSPARPTPNDPIDLTYTVDGFTDVSCLADSNGDGFVDLDVNEATNSVTIPPLPVGTYSLKVVCEGTVSDDVTVIVAPAAPSNVRKRPYLVH